MSMRTQAPKQDGAVLIIALLLLVVMTLLGLSAMQNTTLEERMAGNMRSENVAFQAAEGGLRAGEAWLANLTGKPLANASGSAGVWLLDGPDPDSTNDEPWWRERNETWWAANGTEIGTDLEYIKDKKLAKQPRYVVEERGVKLNSMNLGQQQDFTGLDYYQVTARGQDMSERSEVMVRSTFARRF